MAEGTSIVAKFMDSLPAELRAQMAEEVATDLARLGKTGGRDAIKIRGKNFVFPDETTHPGPLDMIVVDFVYRNEYYDSAYNAKDIKAPVCFAVGPEQLMLVPTENSPKRQALKCAECPRDAFGSQPNGDGKACKNAVYMAVMTPDATDDSPLYVIKTSPTGITPFNRHVSKVGRMANLPVWAVITRVFFEPNSDYPTLRFDIAGPNPIPEVIMARRTEARHRLMQEPDFSTSA